MNSLTEPRSRKADRASVDAPDFSLELSGGLESETNDEYNSLENIISLDPEVLASLVIQLRTNLSSAVRERNDARGERDALIGDLAVVQTRLQELESTGEREVEYLNEMMMWRKRCEEAEEQIGMLRGKVEESRRAVMTLQTQSRRLSQLSVPYASSPHAQSFTQEAAPRTPGFQKRMSLQVGSTNGQAPTLMGPPPKGRAHNRRSSVSEPEVGTISSSGSSQAPSSFPDTASRQSTSDQDHDSSSLSRSASRRHSAMITRPTESLLNPMGAELESLRQELIAVRVELMDARRELWESNEAKEASDVCLRALKEFIAENNVGDSKTTGAATTQDAGSMRGLSLPPLPTDNIADEEDGDWTKTPVASHAHSGSVSKKGWGLGFWSSPTAPAAASSAATKSVSNDTAVSQSSTSSVPSTKSTTVLAPTTAISSFVSRWRTGSVTSPSPPVVPAVSSPKPTSSPSAFSWYSSTPPASQTTINDNYTPAPVRGTLSRRPSAYSSPSYDSENSSGRNGTFSDKKDIEAQEMDKRDTIIGPREILSPSMQQRSDSPDTLTSSSVENISSSPTNSRHPYLDSTPSLTDAETMGTNASSGSENEPGSPYSTRSRLTPSRKGSASDSIASVEKRRVSSSSTGTGTSGVKISIQRRASSASRSSISEQDAPAVPPLPLSSSPRMPEFTRVPPSPKNTSGSPKMSPILTEGRKKLRSRAPSGAVVAGAAMETIDESAVEKEKRTSLTK